MNRMAWGILGIAILAGIIKFLDYRGDKQVHDHLVEMTRQSIDNIVSQTNSNLTPQPTYFDEYTGYVIKAEKINDLTIKSTIELDDKYNGEAKYANNVKRTLTVLQDARTKDFCHDKKISDFIKVGMVNQFDASFGNGTHIGEFTIDKKACDAYVGENRW